MVYRTLGAVTTVMRLSIVSVCLLAIAALPSSARSSRSYAIAETEADELAPGSYTWNASADDGPLSMVIRLGSQRAYVYRGGRLVAVSTIASGKPGYETPNGTFTVLEKERMHHSNKYDNAPMPYMQRLSWSGLALHGGHPHGYPASHGCIRLPMGFAAALFKEPTQGMEVVITGQAPGRREIIASRQRSHCCGASKKSDDLQFSKFAAPPDSGETDDQTDDTVRGDVNQYTPPPQGYQGDSQGRSRDYSVPPDYTPPPPPQDLPPPPG